MDFSSIALTDTPTNPGEPLSHSPTYTAPAVTGAVTPGMPMGLPSGIPSVAADDSLDDPLDEGHMFGTGRSAAMGPQGMVKLRRDSIAHSQGMGGVSWGSLTIGSWLRDEVMFHATLKNSRSNSVSKTTVHLYPQSQGSTRRPSHSVSFAAAGSPPVAYNAYLPNLEKQYCKDYSCCGLSLPGLHDLLRHYEEAHIATSPGSSTAVPGTTGSLSKKRLYRQQTHSDASIPRQHVQQQQLQQFRKTAPAQHSNPHQQQQQQHHIIQQQLSPRATVAGTATGSRASHSPPPLAGATSVVSEPSQGPQIHLNGSLVDAVSTNDVFLQAGSNGAGVHPQRNAGARQRHEPMQQQHHHNQPANSVHQSSTSHKGKIPLTPQHSFNTYSLQNGKQPRQSGGSDGGNTNYITHSPSDGFSGSTSNNNGTGSNSHNNNKNHSRKFPSKFSVNISTGLELDFMDEDMVGSDMEETDSATFMRLASASPHSTIPLPTQSSSSVSSRFPSMGLTASVHRPTPPTSTAGLPGSLMNVSDTVHGVGVDEDDDDDDEDDDEDDDMAGGASNCRTKVMQNNFHRQEGYIDDPARRLYVMDHEEHKPFKCPVIGCDKTYKNQNGLKYHKLHGHQNQKLHENADGTFSIIDPESNEPYPDGMGYEKDKPYRCEVCGKRYKNLNGLKYHRGHSTH